ncbi:MULTISPECIES: DNA polymerase I [unclassified Myroides]|uniref:DNA polymerase I n=1 Tax=unclassified Myroides TaxID=2642485 RepID=UPI0015F9B345|nr:MULTISPECIES: DNA polymerase I [unclassified Myroides]MBB1150591.1 DNA polymerase I [Myroides sp. NP-2]MDM1407178.1 DNA polymerase I [Myroides sp. DF42-4-2]
MAQQKRLFLLDAYALIFRGYYALIKNPRVNSKGLDTSAILGFMNSLLDVIKRENPDHLAVAFDNGGSKDRLAIFPEYKANRDVTPEAIKIAVPYIKEILKAMHIPIIEVAGFEADDLIGTISKQAEKEDFKVFMVTPDKDYAQLVSDNIVMYRPARMGNGIEIWDVEKVKEKFEVDHPEQVIDFLGMMGDAVDNIPGLPGVGEKTAKKFIKEYGSMENLLANTHELKGKMKENIEANKEKGLLSKQLATIILDCPVEFNADNYILEQPDVEKTDALFIELEFRRMKEQFDKIFASKSASEAPTSTVAANSEEQLDLFGTAGGSSTALPFETLETKKHMYQLAQSPMAIRLLAQQLMQQKSVCFDTETTGLDPLTAELVGISFSFEKGTAFYVPLSANKDEVLETLAHFKPFFESETIEKIGQNLKYDIKVLKQYGIQVNHPLFDTMIAHYLINPDMRHNMDVLAETYLKYTPQPIEALLGKKGKNQKTMREIEVELVKEYAGEDADITFQLKQEFLPQLEATATLDLFKNIEIPLVSVLADMENEGIRLDVEFLQSLSSTLDSDIKQLEQAIYETAGETFNLASPKQLGDILFEKLQIGGAKPKKTKTGQYATGEEILSELAPKHQIVADILNWRQLIKLQNTYVDALPKQINSSTNRIHTEYMQAVAATGRLSSNNPNLQNIPIRTERGRLVRKAFVARDENYVLLAADYSQIELRIIAALSEEPNMIESFKKGEDIHRSTAARVFNVPLEEVTKEQRSHAKTVNFGIIYGVSAFGLSNQTNLSRAESKELIDTYYETYPKLKDYIAQQIEFAREYGYVQTILGRRRYLKDIHSQNAVVRSAAERNAVNAPIQGSAADIIKIAMIRIHKRLVEEQWQSKMLLQVHDELVFDAHKAELEALKTMVKQEMENAFTLAVPLVVDLGTGENWLQAH